jgi:hypothetical protein
MASLWFEANLLCLHTSPAVTQIACVTNLGDGGGSPGGAATTPIAL